MTIPCRKQVYRLVGKDNIPIVDLLVREGIDEVPVPGGSYLCRHPADDKKQARVRPSTVIPLLHPVWVGKGYSAFCPTSTVRVVVSVWAGMGVRLPGCHVVWSNALRRGGVLRFRSSLVPLTCEPRLCHCTSCGSSPRCSWRPSARTTSGR